MVKQGFTQFEWILEEGAAGELFAFGVSERGNSRVLADSTTVVQETAEGFDFSGTKIFAPSRLLGPGCRFWGVWVRT